jgi:hypothetical protein
MHPAVGQVLARELMQQRISDGAERPRRPRRARVRRRAWRVAVGGRLVAAGSRLMRA